MTSQAKPNVYQFDDIQNDTIINCSAPKNFDSTVNNSCQVRNNIFAAFKDEVQQKLNASKDPIAQLKYKTFINMASNAPIPCDQLLQAHHSMINNSDGPCNKCFVQDMLYSQDNMWATNIPQIKNADDAVELASCVTFGSQFWDKLGVQCDKYQGAEQLKNISNMYCN